METSDTRRLAFIVPFLGSWPQWAALFFEGCRLNRQIAVLILCDYRPPFAIPENVQVIQMKKNEMISRFENSPVWHWHMLLVTSFAISGRFLD